VRWTSLPLPASGVLDLPALRARLLRTLIPELPARTLLRPDHFGAPTLPGSGWHLSFSRGGRRLSAAACQTQRVGIDLEHLQDRDGPRPAGPDLRRWVITEAVLKAYGTGFALVGTNEPFPDLHLSGHLSDTARWGTARILALPLRWCLLTDLEPAGLCGAVAVTGPGVPHLEYRSP